VIGIRIAKKARKRINGHELSVALALKSSSKGFLEYAPGVNSAQANINN